MTTNKGSNKIVVGIVLTSLSLVIIAMTLLIAVNGIGSPVGKIAFVLQLVAVAGVNIVPLSNRFGHSAPRISRNRT